MDYNFGNCLENMNDRDRVLRKGQLIYKLQQQQAAASHSESIDCEVYLTLAELLAIQFLEEEKAGNI
jgi:hypothetical protein